MIAYARKQHIWVQTVTNGSLLHQQGLGERLLATGVNQVQFSIDGATPATYASIRKGGRFDKVVANARAFNELAHKGGRPITNLRVVVQSENLAELEGLVELASELGFTSLLFTLSILDWSLPSFTALMPARSALHEFEYERGLRLVDRGQSLGVKVAFGLFDLFDPASPQTVCPWPFERPFISSDLRVVPCCIISNPDTLELGRITPDVLLDAVWNSDVYSAFRQAHLEGNIPAPCRNCDAKPGKAPAPTD